MIYQREKYSSKNIFVVIAPIFVESALTFECEVSLSARHGESGDTPVVLFVESVAQDLPPVHTGLLPGQDDGVALHRGGLDVRRGCRDWK